MLNVDSESSPEKTGVPVVVVWIPSAVSTLIFPTSNILLLLPSSFFLWALEKLDFSTDACSSLSKGESGLDPGLISVESLVPSWETAPWSSED